MCAEGKKGLVGACNTAFGWLVKEIDGHNILEIKDALDDFR
jgi:transketolase N-terminal domain/subunit